MPDLRQQHADIVTAKKRFVRLANAALACGDTDEARACFNKAILLQIPEIEARKRMWAGGGE